jgi:hypothetical protein
VDAARAGAWLAETHVDRSAAFGDLDGDGDVDMVVGELNGPVRVIENDGAGAHHLVVELADRRPGVGNPPRPGQPRRPAAGRSHPDPLGLQRRQLPGGLGRLCPLRPPHGRPVRLEVTWSDGVRQAVEDVGVDRRMVVDRR